MLNRFVGTPQAATPLSLATLRCRDGKTRAFELPCVRARSTQLAWESQSLHIADKRWLVMTLEDACIANVRYNRHVEFSNLTLKCPNKTFQCMRTTIRLDDRLLRLAKQRAAERGKTLNAVIEEALRASLAARPASSVRVPIELPSFRGNGLQPGVDLDDSAALLDLMEKGM